MIYASISLIVISAVLIVLSFFQRDKIKELEEEVEQLSMEVVQDKYKLERKIKVLEEELLVGPSPSESFKSGQASEEEVAISLYQKGYTAQQIAQFTSTPLAKVQTMLQSVQKKGANSYE